MAVRDLLRGGPLTASPADFRFDNVVAVEYDELLVPPLFAPWAKALVERLAPARGSRALDVATGPGTVARALSAAVGSKGQVAGCDVSPSMIARAVSREPVPGGAPIAYTVSPAAPLPYPDAAFNAVTCQQGLQFFPDAAAALTEFRRVLVQGGRLAVSVWCPPEECPAFDAYRRALLAAGQPALAELMRIPFPRWTGDDLVARAREIGFGYLHATVESRDLVFAGGVTEAVAAFRGTPIGPMLEALTGTEREAILEAARETYAPLTTDGVVRGAMRSWILLATA